MTDYKLLPCPFCGGPVDMEITIDGRKWYGIVCRNTLNRGGSCAVSIRPSASEDAAVERWNRRAWQAARTVPDGWRIDRCSDGSINVIKDGYGGANVEQNAEQTRYIPEEVLWMLANDLLSAAPEGKK